MGTQLHLVAAFGNQGQVGLNNRLPWHLPDELRHFKDATIHSTVIMGRKTFESIGMPLPRRRNIVVSQKVGFIPGAEVVGSLEEALALVKHDHKVVIIGGVSIWNKALPHATHLVLSMVNYNGDADTSLPESFFENVRSGFRLDHLRHQEDFTATYWIRNAQTSS